MSAYEIGFVRKGSFAAVQTRHLAYLQANNPKNAAIPCHQGLAAFFFTRRLKKQLSVY